MNLRGALEDFLPGVVGVLVAEYFTKDTYASAEASNSDIILAHKGNLIEKMRKYQPQNKMVIASRDMEENIENLDVKVAERLDDRLSMIEDTVCNEVRELRNEVKEVREKFDKFEETFENSRRRSEIFSFLISFLLFSMMSYIIIIIYK